VPQNEIIIAAIGASSGDVKNRKVNNVRGIAAARTIKYYYLLI
jgi:hypothetical protein